jgi:hypothetical protein
MQGAGAGGGGMRRLVKRTPLEFLLPNEVREIAHATQSLRECYKSSGLNFTPDGKFVGDLGEAIAVEMFGIKLEQGKGIDGYCGVIPVQIKTTGRPNGGAAFRTIDESHPKNTQLIAYFIDWEKGVGELIYNGTEALVRPDCKGGQREASRHKLLTTEIVERGSIELPILEEFQKRYMA